MCEPIYLKQADWIFFQTGEMMTVSAAKPDDPSSVSGTHLVEGENFLPQVFSDHPTCAVADVYVRVLIHTQIK